MLDGFGLPILSALGKYSVHLLGRFPLPGDPDDGKQTLFNIQLDQVALFHQSYRAAGLRLGTAVADHRPGGCAGIQRRYPCEEFPMEDWNEVIEVNLIAPFELSQLAAKEYLKKDVPYGKIINFASMLSFFGGLTVPAYAASKGGVTQFSKTMTNELAGKGININCIAPGYMDTEMNTALTDPNNPRNKEITDRIPTHRWGTPEDLKGVAIFLSSHASDYINGAVITVDGGFMVK